MKQWIPSPVAASTLTIQVSTNQIHLVRLQAVVIMTQNAAAVQQQ